MNPIFALPLVAVGCFFMGQGCPHPNPRRQLTIGGAIVVVSVIVALATAAIGMRR